MERVNDGRELLALKLFAGVGDEPPTVNVRADLAAVDEVAFAVIACATAEADLIASLARDPRVSLDALQALVVSVASIQAPAQRALDDRRQAMTGGEN